MLAYETNINGRDKPPLSPIEHLEDHHYLFPYVCDGIVAMQQGLEAWLRWPPMVALKVQLPHRECIVNVNTAWQTKCHIQVWAILTEDQNKSYILQQEKFNVKQLFIHLNVLLIYKESIC